LAMTRFSVSASSGSKSRIPRTFWKVGMANSQLFEC
jgi:hypothetical protein